MHGLERADSDRSQGMRYQRLMALGSGGMANVHLSLAIGQSGFKRLAVVKSVRRELFGDPVMRQMFLAEARLSARLNHPNVVQVSEVVDTAEGVMLVMEYLDGLSFAAACRAAGSAMTLPMVLRVICDVLAGLHYAHDLVDYHGKPLGIVHRDVSAQNIFLTFDGRVKLLDFGIAKVTSDPERTRTGVIKGRVAYMPVEQVTGKAVDRRTDVYAVGCLLWEAVAGTRMWGKLSEPQIMRNVLRGSIPRLGEHVQVDPALERIVTKATAQLPDDRYASAEELRLDLETFLKTTTSPQVSARDIGLMLSSVSTQARAERQRVLAEAIAVAEQNHATHLEDLQQKSDGEIPSHTMLAAQPSGAPSRPHSMMRSMSPTPGPYLLSPLPAATDESRSGTLATAEPAPRSRRIWIPVALAAVLAGAAWVPSLLDQPAAHLAGPPQQAQETVHSLTLEVTPADALVFLDGKLLVGRPLRASVSSARPHVVRVERDGYQANERSVLVESDATISIELAPESAAAEQPESGASEPSAKPRRGRAQANPVPAAVPVKRAPGPAPSTRPGCTPPYFFSGGIKTYKPECI